MSSALSKKVQEEEDGNDSDLFDDDVLNGSDVDEKETPSTLSDVPTPTLSYTESESQDETSKESQAASSSARHEILYQIEFFNEHSKSRVLSLQFISPRCTLYEVVECLFENYLEEHLSQAIYSHLWCLFVDKKNEFIGPFPDSVFCESQKPCCPEEPVLLSALNLKVGQEIKFHYDLGSTTKLKWKIVGISLATEENIKNREDFPRVTPASDAVNGACVEAKANTAMIIKKNNGKGDITVPFLSAEELLESKTFRVKRESNSDVVWGNKPDKSRGSQSPWCDTEKKAVCLLLYADLTFAKAWAAYLEHSLLTRTKGATSVTWYSVRNSISECDTLHDETHWLHSGGRVAGEKEKPSKEQLIQRSLQLLRTVRQGELTRINNTDGNSKKRKGMDEEEVW
mmetsp:Transcript_15479/g.14830  ORF Transcript_15479/g.14830 Transcript_15479/m.14830 type:complete len:399 (-) Transcript_15479:738-1934(-)|eukprot:CAMPEP_0119045262 /NCGR_PEP_ID=MMETSP1177-20130426/38593_1 /TAXON_ID=2985 /ORGANISM="Ochromonas sp, Strain CCMP1899" /LENGTH=398 /DNA_ID=CAMNT_0007016759 /DNA_START=87 /DNA_END=1280 /DNA_ORIENTATION=-